MMQMSSLKFRVRYILLIVNVVESSLLKMITNLLNLNY